MPQKQKSKHITKQEDAQSAGLLVLFIGFGVAYLSAELIMISQPHLGHWLVAGVVAVIASALGYGLMWWQLKRR